MCPAVMAPPPPSPRAPRKPYMFKHTYVYPMAVKTITVTEDAYAKLAGLKRPGESFSELIQRMTMRRPLADLVGILDGPQGDAMARAVVESRKDLDRSTRRTAKRLVR